jgi:hypothetical protein
MNGGQPHQPAKPPLVLIRVVAHDAKDLNAGLPTIVVTDTGSFYSIDNVLLDEKSVARYFRRTERDKTKKDIVIVKTKNENSTSVATLFSAVDMIRLSAEPDTENEIIVYAMHIGAK